MPHFSFYSAPYTFFYSHPHISAPIKYHIHNSKTPIVFYSLYKTKIETHVIQKFISMEYKKNITLKKIASINYRN